jgi:dipeptidase E
MGTSAGANVAGQTISTSNDMAIVLPPSLQGFAFVPFNLNPHYIEAPKDSKHMGETREMRI